MCRLCLGGVLVCLFVVICGIVVGRFVWFAGRVMFDCGVWLIVLLYFYSLICGFCIFVL